MLGVAIKKSNPDIIGKGGEVAKESAEINFWSKVVTIMRSVLGHKHYL